MLRLLQKRVRVHVFLKVMNRGEIERVLVKYIPRMHSIQGLKSGTSKLADYEEYQVLCDEYNRCEDRIVEEAREELKKEFSKKLCKNMDPVVKNVFMKSLNNV